MSEVSVHRHVQLRAPECALHAVHGARLENDERAVARNVLSALACVIDSPSGTPLVREIEALMKPVVTFERGDHAKRTSRVV
jgi:hypothetical protein